MRTSSSGAQPSAERTRPVITKPEPERVLRRRVRDVVVGAAGVALGRLAAARLALALAAPAPASARAWRSRSGPDSPTFSAPVPEPSLRQQRDDDPGGDEREQRPERPRPHVSPRSRPGGRRWRASSASGEGSPANQASRISASTRLGGRAQRQREHVGVVPAGGRPRRSRRRRTARRGPADLVGGDRGARAGPAADDGLLGAAVGDVAGGGLGGPGPVVALAPRTARRAAAARGRAARSCSTTASATPVRSSLETAIRMVRRISRRRLGASRTAASADRRRPASCARVAGRDRHTPRTLRQRSRHVRPHGLRRSARSRARSRRGDRERVRPARPSRRRATSRSRCRLARDAGGAAARPRDRAMTGSRRRSRCRRRREPLALRPASRSRPHRERRRARAATGAAARHGRAQRPSSSRRASSRARSRRRTPDGRRLAASAGRRGSRTTRAQAVGCSRRPRPPAACGSCPSGRPAARRAPVPPRRRPRPGG